MGHQNHHHQDHQSKVLYELSALVLNIIRSPPTAAPRRRGDALSFQQQALDARSAEHVRGAEAPIPVQDSMTGQALRCPGQGAAHDAAGPGPAGQKGHQTIGGHLSCRNAGHHGVDRRKKIRTPGSHRAQRRGRPAWAGRAPLWAGQKNR